MKKILLLSCCLLSFACLFGQSTSVDAAEYFFDTDPGVDAASTLTLGSSGAQVSTTASVTVPALSSGFHYLYIRTKDNLGRWSLAESRSIFIYTNSTPPPPGASQIVSAEYFIDTDPGVGSATAFPIGFPGAQITVTGSIVAPALSAGQHILYIRTKDNLGRWSLEEGKSFNLLADPCSTPPTAPTITITQPTCSTPTGAITVTSPSTGVTYSFDNGATFQASNAISGLAAGTYSVKVKDAISGCESAAKSAPVNSAPGAPTAPTVTVTQPTCATPTGAITVTSPASGVTYSFDNGATYQTANTISGLAAGTYSVKVKDASGCESAATTAAVNVAPGSPTAPTVTVTQPTCSTPTGAITVTSPSSGVAYSFDNGATYQAANTISSLASGTYSVKVKDAVSGCESAPTPATVNAAATPGTVAISNLPAKVCKNGTPVPLNGVPAGGAFTIDGISAANFDPVRSSPGNHTVAYMATDANGCPGSATQIVAVGTPIVFDPATAQNLVTCETTTTAGLQTTVSGGAAPLAFQWFLGGVAVSGGTTNPLNFNGLMPSNSGSYTLRATDANGCAATSPPLNLTVHALTRFTVGFTPILCNGQKSTLTITPSGGAVNQFGYSIDGTNYKPANIFSNVAAGAYRVTVVNATLGCPGVQNITVAQPAALTATITKTNISCNNANDGQISVAASGGTAPYLFNFNGAGYLPLTVFPNLAAGTFNVAIKDANGCLLTKNGNTVTNPAALVLSTTSTLNILCAGAATGRIVVSAAGGIGAKQFSKNGGTTWQTSSTFSGLTAGTYQVSAKDANGCLSNTLTVALTEPAAALGFTTVKTNLTCNLSADGAIAVAATGGVAPDSFSINNGGKYFNAGSFTGLTAGNYYVRVKDANGCQAATQTATLTQPGVLNFSTTTTAPACNGGGDGKITVSAPTGGNGAPYMYSADAGATWQTAAIFSGLAAGIYNVKVKDGFSCASIAKIVAVSQPAPITFGVSKQDVACGSTITGVVAITSVGGGTAPYKYSKDGGATFQTGNSFTGLRGGVYPVQVKDAKNCLSQLQNVPIISLCPPGSQLVRYQPTQLIPMVILKIYPNPTDGELVLEVNSLREREQEFLFFDALARLARSEKRNLTKGSQRVPFELSDLPQGMYQIVTPGSAPRGADLRFLKL